MNNVRYWVSMGGTSLIPPTPIPGSGGCIAMFTDPEGNRIGIYTEPNAC